LPATLFGPLVMPAAGARWISQSLTPPWADEQHGIAERGRAESGGRRGAGVGGDAADRDGRRGWIHTGLPAFFQTVIRSFGVMLAARVP